MRKIVLSVALFFIFAAYTLHVRIIGTNAPVVLTPEPNKGKVTLLFPQYKGTTVIPTKTPPPVTTTPTPALVTTTPPPVINTGKYKNGNYTGNSIDAYYGYVQVAVTISGGKIADVQFLDYPQDRQTSVRINSRAMPYLISEAISIQDSKVDTVSGASFTSAAYRKSLASALSQAII